MFKNFTQKKLYRKHDRGTGVAPNFPEQQKLEFYQEPVCLNPELLQEIYFQ